MSVEKLLETTDRPHKMLALDGGGILGMISIRVVARIEAMLRRELGRPNLVLADYFDYMAGTSTGALIASGLSIGMSADEITKFYKDSGKTMFDKDWLYRQYLYSRYTGENLAVTLKGVFGEQTTLGSPFDPARGLKGPKTLLLVVLRNASTDSPWPLSNNPRARYNDRNRPDCNLNLPLWQLVRGSTAAPTYFPPEVVQLGKDAQGRTYQFVFVDGAVTMFNNPAFQLFLMATVGSYNLGWPTGVDKLLLVSIGTGRVPGVNQGLRPDEMNIMYNATRIPSALLAAANDQQDFLCRTFGRCLHGDMIDREIGDMVFDPAAGQDRGATTAPPKHFTYVRYNVNLDKDGLARLNLGGIDPASVQKMDDVSSIPQLETIGNVLGANAVKPEHFADFLFPNPAAAG